MLFADNPGISPISTKTWYMNRKTKFCSDKHSITREKMYTRAKPGFLIAKSGFAVVLRLQNLV